MHVSWEDEMRIAANAGFRGIELRTPKLHGADPGKLRRRAEELGLHILSVNSVEHWGERECDMRAATEVIKMAGALGASYVVLVPGSASTKGTLGRWADQLGEAMATARTAGTRVAIEFLAFPGRGVTTLDLAGQIIEETGATSSAGLVLDSYHSLMAGTTSAMLQRWIGLVRLVHVSDSTTGPTDNLTDETRVFPGEGVLQLRAWVSFLRTLGYQGPWSVEAFSSKYQADAPESVISRAWNSLRTCGL